MPIGPSGVPNTRFPAIVDGFTGTRYLGGTDPVASLTGAGDLLGIATAIASAQVQDAGSLAGDATAQGTGQVQGSGAFTGIAALTGAAQEQGAGSILGIASVTGAGQTTAQGSATGVGVVAATGQLVGQGAVVGVSSVSGAADGVVVPIEGAGAVEGVALVTGTAEAPAPEPVVGPSYAPMGSLRFGGTSGAKRSKDVARWLVEALEAPEETKGRPAKRKARPIAPRRLTVDAERAVIQRAPTPEPVSEALPTFAPLPRVGRIERVRGVSPVTGESWLTAAPVLVGSGWSEGSSWATGTGLLDHEQSEDEMHALLLACT